MSIFGKNIKKIRSLHQLSQQDFAKLFGISRGSVGSYEEGRAEPKIETLIAISKYFKISIDELLKKEQYGLEKTVKIESPEVAVKEENPARKVYLEDRVSLLEDKLQSIEDLLKSKNDHS